MYLVTLANKLMTSDTIVSSVSLNLQTQECIEMCHFTVVTCVIYVFTI